MAAGSLSLEQIAAKVMGHTNNDTLSNNLSNSNAPYNLKRTIITTLLATILSKKEYKCLVRQLYKKIAEHQELSEDDHNAEDHDHHDHHAAKLHVIQVRDLKPILNDLDLGHVVDRMENCSMHQKNETFAYRLTLLRQFTSLDYDALNSAQSISSGGKPISICGGDPNTDSSLHSLGNHSVQGNSV
eukprot:scaffold40628_cov63-Attheya_sp.AAC.2